MHIKLLTKYNIIVNYILYLLESKKYKYLNFLALKD